MKLSRPDLAAYSLVALCLLVLTVLTVLGKPVPDVVTYLAVTALGVGGGVSLQGPAPQMFPPAAPSSTPVAESLPVPRPAPVPLTSDPTTGIIPRVASHDPR